VLVELRRRRKAESTPWQRDGSNGGAKIGLAVEGGGMRGVVSAAMLCALEDLGLGLAFDAVYGCSSGALNGAYFLTGECWYPLSIYYDDLPTKRFIDFRRPLMGQPVLDLDYAFEEVIGKRKPLDYGRLVSSEVPLHVGITSVDRRATILVRDFDDAADLKAGLLASSWLPGAVHGTASFRGERAIDGGVLTAHPYALAAMDGCTHVLSLSTHPIYAPRRYNPVAVRYAYRYLERIEPGLGDGYLQSLESNQRRLRRLRQSMRDPSPGPYVLDLGPFPNAPTVKRHEMDRGKLIEAARSAYELMFSAIEGRPVSRGGVSGVRAVPKFAIVER
jgi:predicted patatin/cPLA2 family phospholipase